MELIGDLQASSSEQTLRSALPQRAGSCRSPQMRDKAHQHSNQTLNSTLSPHGGQKNRLSQDRECL